MSLRKLDKLILGPFIGLFILTLCVAIFILLTQFLLIWFDELIGKDLGLLTYLQLLFYFGINATPQAFPLATLVASLITFGNLGEHAELTALKSAGISVLRVLLPLFVFVVVLSGFVFFSNSYLVPKVNIQAYTLLFDLRRKKPSIAIKEGVFYNGIPGYSIKVDKKLPDQRTLQGIMIYDHTQGRGNVAVTIAESGQLYTICGDQYLVIELFDGCSYLEEAATAPPKREQKAIPSLNRISFQAQKVVLNLASFKLTRSSKDIFSYHHTTKNAHQLNAKIAEIKAKIKAAHQTVVEEAQQRWPVLHEGRWERTPQAPSRQAAIVDTLCILAPAAQTREVPPRPGLVAIADAQTALAIAPSTVYPDMLPQTIQKALDQASAMHSKLKTQVDRIEAKQRDLRKYEVEKYRRLASAVGCIIMFLIGAPLGALIKRGGIGVPLLVSTIFILLYYVADMFGVRWATAGILSSLMGSWLPNLILLSFGLFFLGQAQRDTRLLEGDAYAVLLERLRKYVRKR